MVIRMTDEARALDPETQQISYGLGWMVQDYRGHLQVMHAGMIDGFRAHLALLPKDGYAFAILANREGTRMNLALSNALTDLLLGLATAGLEQVPLGVQADEDRSGRVAGPAGRAGRDRRDPRRRGTARTDWPASTKNRPTGRPRSGPARTVWCGNGGPGRCRWNITRATPSACGPRATRTSTAGCIRFVIEDGQPREYRFEGMAFRRVGK